MKKRIIQSVIFLAGVFLFAVVLSPRYFNDQSDSKGVDSPCVFKDGHEYRMYYAGHYRGGAGSIHLATSNDGVKWEKFATNPVLKWSRFSSTDSVSATNPVVIKNKDGYKCFYFGHDTNGEKAICLAESKSTGTGWRKHKKNPVFTKERPIPTSAEVKRWSDEKLADYLKGLYYPSGKIIVDKVDKGVWLQQFLRILQESESREFMKYHRLGAMTYMAWTMDDDVIDMDFRIPDYEKVRREVEKMAKGIEEVENVPSWQEAPFLKKERIDELIGILGVPDEAFEIPRRDMIVKVLRFLERKTDKESALRYYKILSPSAIEMTRMNIPVIRDNLRRRLMNGGLEGDELMDFSIIYDEDVQLYKMWYIGEKKYEGESSCKLLGYAESEDGLEWVRKPGKYPKGSVLDFKKVSNVAVAKCDDGRFRMIVTGQPKDEEKAEETEGEGAGQEGDETEITETGPAETAPEEESPAEEEKTPDAYAFETEDVLDWGAPVGKVYIKTEKGDNFDDGGIKNLFLTQIDGKYHLYYGGDLNDWDTPFPTEKELKEKSVKDLYKYATMVGFLMKRWDREYNFTNLALAKTILENPDDLDDLPLETIQDLAHYYKVEFDLTGHDLDKIDSRLFLFYIRKAFLKRTFIKYGKAISYPSVEEIEQMDQWELQSECGRYGIAIMWPDEHLREELLKKSGESAPDDEEVPTAEQVQKMDHIDLVLECRKREIKTLKPLDDNVKPDEMRRELKAFSQMCEGKEDYLDRISRDDLIRIIVENDLSVKLAMDEKAKIRTGYFTKLLPRDQVKSIPRRKIQEVLASTLKARRGTYLEQQRVVTRIGLAKSEDFEEWERIEGSEVSGSVLTNDKRGTENPLMKWEGQFSRAITILGWFAVGLGLVNLTRHHGTNVLKRGKNWMMSTCFFASLLGSLVIMILIYPYYSQFTQVPNAYKFMQDFIAEPIIATILGLLGYYITSAAYRAFRVKNTEAAMMMLIAVLCMLGNISMFEPFSRRLFLHTAFDQLHFPFLRDWLMSSANAAVFRGLNFGISIGVVAMSIRIILSLEKGAFFEKL